MNSKRKIEVQWRLKPKFHRVIGQLKSDREWTLCRLFLTRREASAFLRRMNTQRPTLKRPWAHIFEFRLKP